MLHSVRAKMDGGKQINCIQSGSFQHQCMAADLRLTLGPTWTADSWKHFFGSCSDVLETLASKYKQKHHKNTDRNSTTKYKKAQLEKALPSWKIRQRLRTTSYSTSFSNFSLRLATKPKLDAVSRHLRSCCQRLHGELP